MSCSDQSDAGETGDRGALWHSVGDRRTGWLKNLLNSLTNVE